MKQPLIPCFTEAYFRSAYENSSISGEATEAERARFTPAGIWLPGPLHNPYRIHKAKVEGERAASMPAGLPLPKPSFYSTPPTLPSIHSVLSNPPPTGLALPPLRLDQNGLPSEMYAPNMIPLNHHGWHQLQPKHYQPTTDPQAHKLSNGPADFNSFPMIQYHTSGMPTNTDLPNTDAHNGDVKELSIVLPNPKDLPPPYHTMLINSVVAQPQLIGLSNIPANSNNSQQVGNPLSLHSASQADATGSESVPISVRTPLPDPYGSVLPGLPDPHEDDETELNSTAVSQPFRVPSKARRPNNQSSARELYPSEIARLRRIELARLAKRPLEADQIQELRRYALGALAKAEEAEALSQNQDTEMHE
jgi:hypothetical protein